MDALHYASVNRRDGAELLNQIAQFTDSHIRNTRGSHDDLLEMFNVHMSSAVEKLGGSIKELSDHLDELSDFIATKATTNDGRRA